MKREIQIKEVKTPEEIKYLLQVAQQGASQSLSAALKAQLEVLNYVSSPKLLDSSFDLLFANLNKSLKFAQPFEIENIREKTQLIVHNYIFFLQAKLDYQTECNKKQRREILVETTEKVLSLAEDFLREGKSLDDDSTVNKKDIAESIVKQFDKNFLTKVWEFVFGKEDTTQKTVEFYQTLSLLFRKLGRHSKMIGESIILSELIERYKDDICKFRNIQLLKHFNSFGRFISFLFISTIICTIGFGIISLLVNAIYGISDFYANEKALKFFYLSILLIPLFFYIYVRVVMFFSKKELTKLAKIFKNY
ncbi:hypothetical protein ACILD6_04195 [Capnocytophaga canimorsus]|uniref:hypothetical protein n=1 Tax=Capnocytophaga canimorsus TaxID=28188 RepID=UPI000F6BE272|nr:hypothetical protein [Capnocytophaga canimorsus]VEJ20273.1 Uncharacterised protein [Capnocytophaga canimorsus]